MTTNKPIGYDLDQEVLRQFRVIFKSVRKHFQAIEQAAGISGAQLWALSCVAERPGLRVSELAADMSVHQSTASNLVEKLVELGLVRRERDTDDQRVTRLHPTEAAQQRLSGAPGPVRGLLPDALSKLPYDTLRNLHVNLTDLLGKMAALEETGAETLLGEIE